MRGEFVRVLSEEKLRKLSAFIKQYARDNNGAAPGLKDVMNYMTMVKSTAFRYIMELVKRGEVFYSGKNTLESSLQRKMNVSFRKVPIVGRIICGTPDEQEEYVTGYLAVPEEWLEGECFILEAYGDSMIDIGIYDGSIVLVKKASTADNGNVIVALTEDGNTLKRLYWDNGKPRLHSENKTYIDKIRDFYPKELTIQGIVLKVINDIT